MMEMSQLPRVQATEARKAEPAKLDTQQASGEQGEFEQHLNQQIEQAKPEKTAGNDRAVAAESQENQQVAAEAADVNSAGTGTDAESTDQPQVALQPKQDLELSTGATIETESSVEVDVVAESTVASLETSVGVATESVDEELQSLPPDGNPLPPVNPQDQSAQLTTSQATKAEAETMAAPARQAATESIKVSVDLPSTQAKPQANLESATVDSETPEFIAPELKLQTKAAAKVSIEQSPVTAKTSLHMASAVSAASNLQQVPVATAISNINLHTTATATTDMGTGSMPTMSSTLSTPVQSPNWSQGVAERVAWMAQGNFHTAEIKLNPAHLGPMEIKLSISDDNKASVTFVSAHAPVREALDAAVPRLREMLENQGLSLADVDVAESGVEGGQANASDDQDGGMSMQAGHGEQAEDVSVNESLVRVNVSDGVSIYA